MRKRLPRGKARDRVRREQRAQCGGEVIGLPGRGGHGEHEPRRPAGWTGWTSAVGVCCQRGGYERAKGRRCGKVTACLTTAPCLTAARRAGVVKCLAQLRVFGY